MENYIVFGRPDIQQAEIDEVVDSLRSRWLGTGPKVKRFESQFADYIAVPRTHVAAVNSCTAALHLSMISAEIEPGDEVITTALTFCATVNAIIHAGGTPVLADIDPLTLNISIADLENRITPRTRAVIPVHYAGLPCDMEGIMALATKHGLTVIEDCAHAIEAEFQGRKTGTFGQYGCFSFYVTKNMTTGEGGMVVANSDQAINRIKTLALHGMSADAWSRFSDEGYKHYQVVEPGFKYNMMDIQAALGIHQLDRLEVNYRKRKRLFAYYSEAFADLPVQLPADAAPGDRSAYHLFPLILKEDAGAKSRDQLLLDYHTRGIGTGVHYLSIPSHPYYQQTYGWRPEDYPVAFRTGERILSLPFSADLSDTETARVIEVTRSLLA